MAAEGTDNKTLAMLAVLRNMIPAKPRVSHRLNRWIKLVEEVRDTAGKLLDGTIPTDKFIDRVRQESASRYQNVVSTWDMLRRLSPGQIEQASGHHVRISDSEIVLEDKKGQRVITTKDLSDMYQKAKAYFDQMSASPDNSKTTSDELTKLDIYQHKRSGEVFIAYGKNILPLQGGFKTFAQAREYEKANRAALLEKLNALREQSRDTQRNAVNRDRKGLPRRDGDVTPEKFSDAFGFRGVQFGNYVEGPRRQSDLNRAYDALMDLADLLKVPAKAISLNGRLGLAFGARGKGGKNAAAAHYEPGQVAINLTKGNGAGSLAHEWFHSLDNYFGQYDIAKDGNITSGDKYMTNDYLTNHHRNPANAASAEYPVRKEVYDAFHGVMKAIKDSGLLARSRYLDKVRSKPYWSTDIEMAARSFERYVQDKATKHGLENDFLVNIRAENKRESTDTGLPDAYAYPKKSELEGGIAKAFDHLFDTLKTRDTDKGVTFYSREKGNKTLRTPWQKDFPDVVLHARLGDATAHRDYAAAKGGDKDAAFRLVSDVLTKDAADKIRNIIGNREVLLAAVHAEEASGRNKIPQAMADVLGKVLHQEVATGIVQTKRAGRTGQDGFGRLANQPEFAGNVRSDLPYFILDDTLTQGGTLAGLKGYIESHGGRVIGASALTGKQYSARMALSPQTLSQLREHFGGTGLENWWKQQYDHGFDGLTESEASYLLRAGNADRIRDRVLAARSTGDSPVLSEATGDGRSLPPDVKSRYAQKASGTGGFSVTGDGNLLSETGHSLKDSVEKGAKGSSVTKVKAVARTVMNRIKDIDLDVRVVKTQAQAAELAGESLDNHGRVHAFYRPDEHEIVLVADNLPDGRSVREKLRHEIIHHAMESVVTPAEYKTIIDNVLKTRDSDNATIKEIWRKVDASYAEESPQVQAGEFLAHMAEKHTPGRLGMAWNRVISLIKAILRRTGLLQPSDLNDIGYIRDTIRTLGNRVREGYRPRDGGDVSYSRTAKPDPFKADSYDAKAYAADVRRIAELETAPRGTEIRVGDTPHVLRALGAHNRELVMPAHVVHKATRPEIKDHHVSVEIMAELPHLMADPVAVMTSRTEHDSLVTLIEAKDNKGAPVIVAVHMNAKGAVAEVNKIASVYGKDNRKVLQDQLNHDLLYINKEKAAKWLLSAGLQLPGANTINGSITKVLQPNDIRKDLYSRTAKPDPFKVPEGEGERYRKEVTKMMESLRSGDLKVDIGRTPPVLRHLGAPDLPVSISRDTVRKAINDVKHFVDMDTIKDLPELMHDPLVVYQSATHDNSLVLWLNAVDRNGDPVLAAVHMNDTRKRIEVNRVASVYGTEDGKKISHMEGQGLALYRKEKLSRDNPQYSGLQLPKEERSYHDSLNPEKYRLRGLQLPVADGYQGSITTVLQPDDIRKGPFYSRTRIDLSPEETLAARFVRHIQDKFQVLKAVQEKILDSGGKLDDSNNAYLAEELFHGKAENDLNVMKERYIKPLAKLLAAYDIPQSALDEYLYARHAPERNAHIAKINPKMPDGGSGMSNAQAAEIMDKVRRGGKQARYDRLAGIVDDMLAHRRELIKAAGLESKGTVDAWQNAYRHYVPLKGQDENGALPRTGKGYVVSGRESKMAMGRNSKAQSPSTQAMQDLTESLIRNRKNEVGNAFLKLVQDNPDKEYWQIFTDDKPDTTRRIVEKKDPVTGDTIRQVKEMPVPMAMMSDRYFATKKDGKTYYIKLHDDRLMKAMKNMGPETVGMTLRAFGSINRFLSSVNTMYNPVFLVTNFARDLQTAVMSIYGEQGRSDGLLAGKKLSAWRVVRDSPAAMKAVYDSLRGEKRGGKAGNWQKLWKEFVEDGAKTGWFRTNDIEGRMKEMDRLVAQAKGGWQGQSIQAWHAFFKLIEDGNNAVENALRLSAYRHGIDAGMSRQQAASLAKNLTVNFNRRGEMSTVLNSLYMFANASVQGTANMIRALGRLEGNGTLLQRIRWSNLNRVQKLSLAAVGAGYLLSSLNRAGAGQDDDGVNWYDKVPDYVKEHNLVIMKSMLGGRHGEYWTMPLPYGYNMLYLLGGTLEGVSGGNLKPAKATGNIIGGLLGAFNPLGSEDSQTLTGTLLKNLSPTLPRAFVDYSINENFMGTQIRRQNAPWGTPKPDSTLGRRSTPEVYKGLANWLNTATGGSQYRPGAVDINPDSMKYWIDYISGGTGRFIGQTADAAAKTYNGIDIPAQQIPFLGKLSGRVMPYADQQKMYDRMEEIRQYNAELKALHGAERTAFRDKYRGQLSMNGITTQSQNQLKNLRKRRDEIYSDPALTARQQADRVLIIEQSMKKVVDRFNREYQKRAGEQG